MTRYAIRLTYPGSMLEPQYWNPEESRFGPFNYAKLHYSKRLMEDQMLQVKYWMKTECADNLSVVEVKCEVME